MKLSKKAKAEHHEDITSAASKMLRERGIERTSLVDLMHAAGLTHGGFYRHFKSKDELVAQSARQTFGDVVKRFDDRTTQAGSKQALIDYVDEYLSDLHRDDPAVGCMISACGTEAARHSEIVRNAFTSGISDLLDLAVRGLSCPEEHRVERAIELEGLILGAVIMARATNSRELSDSILASARQRAMQIIEAVG